MYYIDICINLMCSEYLVCFYNALCIEMFYPLFNGFNLIHFALDGFIFAFPVVQLLDSFCEFCIYDECLFVNSMNTCKYNSHLFY